MFAKFVDGLIDRMQSQDFWRGIVYIVTAAGASLSPDNAATIVAVGLAISGVIHTIWHKQQGTDGTK